MIVLDVETTGLDPLKNSMVSLGAVDFSNPNHYLYSECRIWDGAEVNQVALDINGFTEGSIRDPKKINVGDAAKLFINFAQNIDDKTIAGENPTLDRDFIFDSAGRFGIKHPFGRRVVDLHSLSYASHLSLGMEVPLYLGKSDLSLDQTLEFVGLPPEPKPHHALRGAKLEAEAISRILYGRSLLKEYSQFPVPEVLIK